MTAMEHIKGQIERLTVSPGECVVISCEQALTQDMARAIKDYARAGLPDGVSVLVLDRGLSLKVVAKQDSEHEPA